MHIVSGDSGPWTAIGLGLVNVDSVGAVSFCPAGQEFGVQFGECCADNAWEAVWVGRGPASNLARETYNIQ